jgi:hypothetical protein
VNSAVSKSAPGFDKLSPHNPLKMAELVEAAIQKDALRLQLLSLLRGAAFQREKTTDSTHKQAARNFFIKLLTDKNRQIRVL